jgi:hypothetical protein
MKCNQTQQQIDASQWESWPNVRKSGRQYQSACPAVGLYKPASDRMKIRPDGKNGYDPHVWCSACNAFGFMQPGNRKNIIKAAPDFIPPVPPLESRAAVEFHEALGMHRDLFIARAINEETIQAYGLGFDPQKRRMVIPCWYGKGLYAMQFRIHPQEEQRVRAWCDRKGVRFNKYLSAKGGCNRVPFGSAILSLDLPYVLIDESPLDAAMLTGLGFPCIAPFWGNNAGMGWPFKSMLANVREIIVIRQNDGEMGGKLARAKLNDLPRARGITAMSSFKDTGEWLKMVPESQRQSRVMDWLRLPPIGGLLEAIKNAGIGSSYGTRPEGIHQCPNACVAGKSANYEDQSPGIGSQVGQEAGHTGLFPNVQTDGSTKSNRMSWYKELYAPNSRTVACPGGDI